MGEAEDSQKLKRLAAAYEYDNDPRWTEYWANVLIPPRMASRSDVVDHFKFKFYQRYIDPDLVVEAISTHISSQPVRPSTLTSTPAPTDRTKPRELGSAIRASGTTRNSVSNPTSLHRNQQTIQIFLNAWVAFVVMLVIFPLVPRNLSNKAYQCSFIGMISSSLYSMFSLYGKPSAWNLQAVQVWLQSIIVTKEFIYFTYCLIFVTSHLCLKFSLVPILCQAFVYIAKLLRCNFSGSYLFRKYLEKPCVWVESNTTTLNILSSQAEIMLGFLLILSLFSWQRNILQTFMYWQLLKLMYHTPATAGYHQGVWAKTGRALNPILYLCAPFLNAPISSIQRWWLRR